MQQLQPLRGQLSDDKVNTCRIARRSGEARDETELDAIILVDGARKTLAVS